MDKQWEELTENMELIRNSHKSDNGNTRDYAFPPKPEEIPATCARCIYRSKGTKRDPKTKTKLKPVCTLSGLNINRPAVRRLDCPLES